MATGPPDPASWQLEVREAGEYLELTDEYGMGWRQPRVGGLYFDLALPYDAFVVGTNSSTPIPIPNGILTPLRIVFQHIGIANPFPRGNTSNAAVVEIR